MEYLNNRVVQPELSQIWLGAMWLPLAMTLIEPHSIHPRLWSPDYSHYCYPTICAHGINPPTTVALLLLDVMQSESG